MWHKLCPLPKCYAYTVRDRVNIIFGKTCLYVNYVYNEQFVCHIQYQCAMTPITAMIFLDLFKNRLWLEKKSREIMSKSCVRRLRLQHRFPLEVSWRTEDIWVNIADSIEITVNLFENSFQGCFKIFNVKIKIGNISALQCLL